MFTKWSNTCSKSFRICCNIINECTARFLTSVYHFVDTRRYRVSITKHLTDEDQRRGSRTAATSKVELFVILVNEFQPLNIIRKSSTLDVAAVLDPPLKMIPFSGNRYIKIDLDVFMSCLQQHEDEY